MVAIVAPFGRRSNASTRACFEFARLLFPSVRVQACQLSDGWELPAHLTLWTSLAQHRTVLHGFAQGDLLLKDLSAYYKTSPLIQKRATVVLGE